MLQKGPEHVLTPTRHKYVHPKAQQIEAKIPVPPVLTVKSKKKIKIFKIFNLVPMCVYTYYGVGNAQY